MARPEATNPLEGLVQTWLSFQEVADLLGTDVPAVRRLVRDRDLLAVRCGTPRMPRIPDSLIDGDSPLPDLRGTLILLADCGFDDLEALLWLLTEDDTLPGTPAQALRTGRKTEIRRRAQALAF
jgi:excisionase family DNA binding protein